MVPVAADNEAEGEEGDSGHEEDEPEESEPELIEQSPHQVAQSVSLLPAHVSASRWKHATCAATFNVNFPRRTFAPKRTKMNSVRALGCNS